MTCSLDLYLKRVSTHFFSPQMFSYFFDSGIYFSKIHTSGTFIWETASEDPEPSYFPRHTLDYLEMRPESCYLDFFVQRGKNKKDTIVTINRMPLKIFILK